MKTWQCQDNTSNSSLLQTWNKRLEHCQEASLICYQLKLYQLLQKQQLYKKTVFEEDCNRLMILKGEGHEIIAKVQFYLPCVTSFPLMIHDNVSILPHFQDLHRDSNKKLIQCRGTARACCQLKSFKYWTTYHLKRLQLLNTIGWASGRASGP